MGTVAVLEEALEARANSAQKVFSESSHFQDLLQTITHDSSYENQAGIDTLISAYPSADLNQSPQGAELLYFAAHIGHTYTVERLLDAKVNVNANSTCGETALHVASSRGYTKTVEFLLANKDTDSWAVSEDGVSVLAGAEGNDDVITLLKDAGVAE